MSQSINPSDWAQCKVSDDGRRVAEEEYEIRKREKQRAYEDEIVRQAYPGQGIKAGYGGRGGAGGYGGGGNPNVYDSGCVITREAYLADELAKRTRQLAQRESMIAELQKATCMQLHHHNVVGLQLARAAELLHRSTGAIHAQAELTLSQAELDGYRSLLKDIDELYWAMAVPARVPPSAAPVAGGMGQESHGAMERRQDRPGEIRNPGLRSYHEDLKQSAACGEKATVKQNRT